MAAIGTLSVVLGTGTHGSRPAASAVGKGGLYSCTTHSLIYQTDGSSWSTWGTLGTSTTTVATDTIWDAVGDLAVGTGSDTAARFAVGSNSGYVLTTRGTGVAPWWTAAAGGGAVATDAIWDAAGDLAIGTGANTAAKLTIGANATVLTSNGTTASWQAPSGGGTVDWASHVNADGSTFTGFTAASGTWAASGGTINQTDTSGTWRRAKWDTKLPLGFPTIMECKIYFVSSGGDHRAGMGITDGSNGSGLTMYLKTGTGMQFDRDNSANLRTITVTVNSSTQYKLRVVIGSEFATAYLDGTIIGNFPLANGATYDADIDYFTLVSYGCSVQFDDVKVWTLSTGAPA